jgi:hypothetical protein
MRKLIISAIVLAATAACSGDAPTAPSVADGHPAALANSAASNAHGSQGSYASPFADLRMPGSHRTADALSGQFTPLNCSPRHESNGSALIGPSGGILRIGNNRLIVPAGALTKRVLISGTVPAGKPFQVNLEPHGLQFRKAAGLILDATSCVDVPDIVYLIDQYTVSGPIRATYSNWWKAIACPIWHFSGYAIAFGNGNDGDAGSAQ